MKLLLTIASVSTLLSASATPGTHSEWESPLSRACADSIDPSPDQDKGKGKGKKAKEIEPGDDDDDAQEGKGGKGAKDKDGKGHGDDEDFDGKDAKKLEKQLDKLYREVAELERKTERKRAQIAALEGQLVEQGVMPASYVAEDAWYRDFSDEEGLVTICHRPPGNAGAAHALRVSPAALQAHLRHGDSLGDCGQPGRPTRAAGKAGKRPERELPGIERGAPRQKPDEGTGQEVRPRKKETTPVPAPKGGKKEKDG